MSRPVFDSSAILAVVNEEPGAEIVSPLLSYGLVSAVNVAEVYTKLIEYNSAALPLGLQILHLLEIVPFDHQQAKLTGELRPVTRSAGLSLGDRACLALGMQLGADVYTAEHVWARLNLDCRIHLIR